MRKTIFRAKSIKGESAAYLKDNADKWFVGYYVHMSGWYTGEHQLWIIEKRAFVPIRTETVGQYLEKVGSNGIPAFEGDIVRLSYSEDKYRVGIIMYDELNYTFYIYTEDKELEWVYLFPIEIIGNATDNPELLELYKLNHKK